jgi:hypothetical protein
MDEAAELSEGCVCPNCGEKMNKSIDGSLVFFVCPACGCTIDAENNNFELNKVCPNCNQTLEGYECSYCGYDLGSDFY